MRVNGSMALLFQSKVNVSAHAASVTLLFLKRKDCTKLSVLQTPRGAMKLAVLPPAQLVPLANELMLYVISGPSD